MFPPLQASVGYPALLRPTGLISLNVLFLFVVCGRICACYTKICARYTKKIGFFGYETPECGENMSKNVSEGRKMDGQFDAKLLR